MSSDTVQKLRQQLAAIEHERWSDWQKWVHEVYRQGNFDKFLPRWNMQIATPYADLSESEKASDLEQVDRYWPLIERYVTAQVAKGRIEGLKKYSKQCGILRIEPSTADLKRHIANLEAELEQSLAGQDAEVEG